MFFKEVLLHNNEGLFNVVVLIENIIPQKSSMPCVNYCIYIEPWRVRLVIDPPE